jgi:hypothetical protein
MKACKTRLLEFLFPRETDHWLAILRVGLGIEAMLYSMSLRIDWTYLLSGPVRRLGEALLSLESHFIPRLGWFVTLAAQVGIDENQLLFAAWASLLVAGCSLVIGFASRASAITAWFVHLCVAKSGDFVSYGMDNFMTIGLFYLMLSPLPDRFSIDWRLRDLRSQDPQFLGFWRRVLQLHLCIIYFFSGLSKCLGSGWWNGSSVWRALIRPPFNEINPEILVTFKHVFPLAGILVCLLEFGYPFLIWSTKTRKIWLISVCGMHVVIAVTMGMYLFSLIMIVLNMAAFGPSLFRLQRKQIHLQPETAGA